MNLIAVDALLPTGSMQTITGPNVLCTTQNIDTDMTTVRLSQQRKTRGGKKRIRHRHVLYCSLVYFSTSPIQYSVYTNSEARRRGGYVLVVHVYLRRRNYCIGRVRFVQKNLGNVYTGTPLARLPITVKRKRRRYYLRDFRTEVV